MRDLIDDVFLSTFESSSVNFQEDQARFDLRTLEKMGDRIAFTTDSFVVDPLKFPGGDIGKLAVCGTVNDLAVGGAVPLYMSCSVIIEEGFAVDELRDIARSMAVTAIEANVKIVTGDTKVVHKGACDKLFINTSGIGVIGENIDLSVSKAEVGDSILVSGKLGDHGTAILCARGDMALSTTINSDCAPLGEFIGTILQVAPEIKFLRDPTRGGVASVLNEIAEASNVGIVIDEPQTPIREEVNGFCEILGLDPLYLANEGRIVAVVPEQATETVLSAMRDHELGRDAVKIGTVTSERAGRVVMNTVFGGQRIVDMLVGEQLPRIC